MPANQLSDPKERDAAIWMLMEAANELKSAIEDGRFKQAARWASILNDISKQLSDELSELVTA